MTRSRAYKKSRSKVQQGVRLVPVTPLLEELPLREAEGQRGNRLRMNTGHSDFLQHTFL